MNENVLEVIDLSVHAYFLHSTERIVDNLSFCLKTGEKLAIVGESGSGKSMIASSLAFSLPDNCFALGKILLDGENLLENKKKKKSILGKQIVFIPQGGAESLNPSLKIKTQIYEVLPSDLSRKQKKETAIRKLERVGLADGERILEKYPFEISGGEAQRVVLACSLCVDAKVIVADEVTRGIDDETSEIFWNCLEKDFKNTAIIVVTHDMQVAKRCDYVLVLKDGKPQEYGKTDEVFSSPQSEYTESLISESEVSYD